MTRYAPANPITIAALALLAALTLVQVFRVAPTNFALLRAVHAIDPARDSDDALARAQAGLADRLQIPRADASPADAMLWRTLGLVYAAQGRPQDALSAWRNDRASSAFLLNRGLLAEYHKEPDAALSWFAYATELSPQDAAPWYRLGAVYENQGNLPAAETHYRQAAALTPVNRDIWFGLARVALEQGKVEPALHAFQQGADASDGRIGRSAFYFQIGRIYERHMDEPDLVSAEAAYRRAAELDDFETVPNWRQLSHYRLGEILAARGEYTSAIDQFNQALAIQPDFREAILSRGSALLHMGDKQGAIQALETVIDSKPDSASMYRQLASLYEELGDNARAQELRKRAAELTSP